MDVASDDPGASDDRHVEVFDHEPSPSNVFRVVASDDRHVEEVFDHELNGGPKV